MSEVGCLGVGKAPARIKTNPQYYLHMFVTDPTLISSSPKSHMQKLRSLRSMYRWIGRQNSSGLTFTRKKQTKPQYLFARNADSTADEWKLQQTVWVLTRRSFNPFPPRPLTFKKRSVCAHSLEGRKPRMLLF